MRAGAALAPLALLAAPVLPVCDAHTWLFTRGRATMEAVRSACLPRCVVLRRPMPRARVPRRTGPVWCPSALAHAHPPARALFRAQSRSYPFRERAREAGRDVHAQLGPGHDLRLQVLRESKGLDAEMGNARV